MRLMFAVAVGLAAVPAFAQDVVQLAPDQVKVILENDRVRVLRFTEPPHSKLPMHSHPAYVAVGFTNDYSAYTLSDGKTSKERTKAGEVTYSKPVTHASEELAGKTSEAVMVELKQPGTSPGTNVTLDPVQVDPKHYKVVLDNNDVRVLRARYGPHEKSVMHEHPAAVIVFMTGGTTKFTMADGASREVDSKAHDAIWEDATKHLPENTGDTPVEAIVIELKK